MANIERFKQLKQLHDTFSAATTDDLDIAVVVDANALQIRASLVNAEDSNDARCMILETIKTSIASTLGGKDGLLSNAKVLLENELLSEAQGIVTKVNSEASVVNDVVAALGGE